jgi:hypothetical protein
MIIRNHVDVPIYVTDVGSDLQDSLVDFCLHNMNAFERNQPIIAFVLLRNKTQGIRLIVGLWPAQYNGISHRGHLQGTHQRLSQSEDARAYELLDIHCLHLPPATEINIVLAEVIERLETHRRWSQFPPQNNSRLDACTFPHRKRNSLPKNTYRHHYCIFYECHMGGFPFTDSEGSRRLMHQHRTRTGSVFHPTRPRPSWSSRDRSNSFRSAKQIRWASETPSRTAPTGPPAPKSTLARFTGTSTKT